MTAPVPARRRRERRCAGRARRSGRPGGQLGQRSLAGDEVGPELLGGRRLVAGVPALGVPDDEVPLEAGRVVLEGAEQAADVAAALGARRDVVGAGDEPVRVRSAPARVSRGSRPTWSRSRSSWARRSSTRRAYSSAAGSRLRGGSAAGRRGRRRAGRPRAARGRVRSPAPGAWPGRERGPVERGVEPPPDQGREPLALGAAHPPAVPGGEQELVPVGGGLPQGHRQGEVGGELVGAGGPLRRRVEVVELGPASAQPGLEGGEVGLHGRRVERLTEPARAVGGGQGGHGVRPYAGSAGWAPGPSVGASQWLYAREPRPVGAHLLEHAVDEADQVDLVRRDADAVRLVGERLAGQHDGVGVLGGQPREDRVVAGDGVDLAPPGTARGSPVWLAAGDRDRRRGEPDEVVHARGAAPGRRPSCRRGRTVPVMSDPLRTRIFCPALVVLRSRRRCSSTGRR